MDYLKARGFDVPDHYKKYTINENLLGTTISGSEIDEFGARAKTPTACANPGRSGPKPRANAPSNSKAAPQWR